MSIETVKYYTPLRQLDFKCKDEPLKTNGFSERADLFYLHLKHFEKIILADVWRMEGREGEMRPLRRLLEYTRQKTRLPCCWVVAWGQFGALHVNIS